MLTDTHTHLYLPDFDGNRDDVIGRAFDQGVNRLFLPNIDAGTVAPMYELCRQYPGNCFPMLGLHPCSVDENFQTALKRVKEALIIHSCYAIGEIGIDLYWDRTFIKEQEEAFRIQIGWAAERDLPIVIHQRESFDEIYRVLLDEKDQRTRGIFHCFTGTYEQAYQVIEAGFYLGIGGVVTFKNSGLAETLSAGISLDHIVLETDSPYLAPAPYRGKRNESSYLIHVARKLSMIYGMPEEEIARRTTANSELVFGV